MKLTETEKEKLGSEMEVVLEEILMRVFLNFQVEHLTEQLGCIKDEFRKVQEYESQVYGTELSKRIVKRYRKKKEEILRQFHCEFPGC